MIAEVTTSNVANESVRDGRWDTEKTKNLTAYELLTEVMANWG